MDRIEVFDKVVEICLEVFDNDEIVLDESSCAADIEEWDSLAHLGIISDLEDEFNIKFSLDEIMKSKNLGELINAIIKHLEE